MYKHFNLLVIEDEPIILASIRKILGPEDITMDEALHSDVALSKLKRNTYDLIVTDLMLPRISGMNLVQTLTNICPSTPLIVITGYATMEMALQSFRLNAFDFIPKPFDTEVFLAVVCRGLNYSRLLKEENGEVGDYVPVPDEPQDPNGFPPVHCLGSHSQFKIQENGAAVVRVGETFPRLMDGLERIEFFHSNEEIIQGKCCAQFIARDGLVHRLWAPLSGTVHACNERLNEDIRLIDTDPYESGWIFRCTPNHLEEEMKYLTLCMKRNKKKG